MKKFIDVMFSIHELGQQHPQYFSGATQISKERWDESEGDKGKWWL